MFRLYFFQLQLGASFLKSCFLLSGKVKKAQSYTCKLVYNLVTTSACWIIWLKIFSNHFGICDLQKIQGKKWLRKSF